MAPRRSRCTLREHVTSLTKEPPMRAQRLTSRASDARRYRHEMADLAAARLHPPHVTNGEETEYQNPAGQLSYIANYSKALPHNQLGEVDPAAYRALLRALDSGDPRD